jgi:hypothetical protein
MKLFGWVRRHWLASAICVVGLGGLALAQGQQIITTLSGTELFSVQTGPLNVAINASNLGKALANLGDQIGGSTGVMTATGKAFSVTGTAATTGTTVEQTLATYTLPANAMNAAGRRVRITAQFQKLGTSSGVVARIYFGSTTFTMASDTLINSTEVLTVNANELATANTQIVWAAGTVGTTAISGFNSIGTNATASPIVINATCQNLASNAGDCQLNDFAVEFMN